MPKNWPEISYSQMLNDGLEIVAAVRETVGWEMDLAVDIHRNMQPAEAVAYCQELEKFRLYFVEDPIVPVSVVAMGEVAD